MKIVLLEKVETINAGGLVTPISFGVSGSFYFC